MQNLRASCIRKDINKLKQTKVHNHQVSVSQQLTHSHHISTNISSLADDNKFLKVEVNLIPTYSPQTPAATAQVLPTQALCMFNCLQSSETRPAITKYKILGPGSQAENLSAINGMQNLKQN